MNHKCRLTISALLILTSLSVFGAPVDIDKALMQAQNAAAEQRLGAMARAYENILAAEPDHVEARVGLATALAWQGKYREALEHFDLALFQDANHLAAIVGKTYALSWSEQFDEAAAIVSRALEIYPENTELLKARAYNELWSGQSRRSLIGFSQLSDRFPTDPEFRVAQGWAYHGLKQEKRAYAAFRRALALDPDRAEAKLGLRAARSLPTMLDFTIVGGSSAGADSGLRFLELGTWVGSTRIYGQYDNSLSLDNPALARLGEEAETFQIGTVFNITDGWLGAVEVGQRQLPDGDQDIQKLELVRLFDGGALQAGAQRGRHDLGFTDELLHLGWAIRLNDQWNINPHFYRATTGADEDDEWRFLVETKYLGETGWEVIVGLGAGQIDSANRQADGRLEIANLKISLPIGHNRVFAGISREQTPVDDFTVATVGVQFRLARN